MAMEYSTGKTVTSVCRPKIKRDAGVNAVFLIVKRQHFTPASLFIFGRRTDVMALVVPDKPQKIEN